MSIKKVILIIVACLVLLSTTLCTLDFIKVKNFEKPTFTFIGKDLQKDGGSGTFIGLGYSVKIKGNFMADISDETIIHGVTYYEFYILGFKVASDKRKS